jgi:hypothetical protein
MNVFGNTEKEIRSEQSWIQRTQLGGLTPGVQVIQNEKCKVAVR